MTLEQAIENEEQLADFYMREHALRSELDHRQLAEWLKELKKRREDDRRNNREPK